MQQCHAGTASRHSGRFGTEPPRNSRHHVRRRSSNVFDTYLSPQEYTGIDFRVSRESMRMTRWMDGRLSLQSFFQADLGYTRNKADNNNTFSALANWNYGLHYNFPINGRLTW